MIIFAVTGETGSVILIGSSSYNCAPDPEMEEVLDSLDSADVRGVGKTTGKKKC